MVEWNGITRHEMKWHETKYSDKEIVKARAGHSMTVVEEKIYIIGGSFG